MGGAVVLSFITMLNLYSKLKLEGMIWIHIPLKALCIICVVDHKSEQHFSFFSLYSFSAVYLLITFLLSFIDWVIVKPNTNDYTF
jgi:hypothetical protein